VEKVHEFNGTTFTKRPIIDTTRFEIQLEAYREYFGMLCKVG
jgi:hypothetical protein